MPKLAGILIRFRLATIAITADIEKAFLTVGLDERDRDSMRFLWLHDINTPPTNDNIKFFRFTRIAFGINASPFLLGATIRHHLELTQTPMAKELINNTYVDNILITAQTEAEAIQKYHNSKELFKRANMNLRDYISNSKKFNADIPQVDKVQKSKIKFLGISNLERQHTNLLAKNRKR